MIANHTTPRKPQTLPLTLLLSLLAALVLALSHPSAIVADLPRPPVPIIQDI